VRRFKRRTATAAAAAALIGMGMAPASSSPTPAPADLQEIGRVRNSYLCAVLQKRVKPAIAKLADADRSIEAGKAVFLDISRNEIAHLRAAMQLDHVTVENEVTEMVKDHTAVEALLSSGVDFPKDPDSDEARLADELRSRLEAVEKAQQVEINALNGTIETERLGQMEKEGMSVMAGVVGPAGASSPAPNGFSADEPLSYLDVAGLPATPDLLVDPRVVAGSGVIGDTVYGKMAIAVYGKQVQILHLEQGLAAVVAPLERRCAPGDLPGASPHP
jgi:hypothetical protein